MEDSVEFTTESFNLNGSLKDCFNSLNLSSSSSNSTEKTYSIDDNIQFIFNGIGIFLLTIFGVTANLLSVIVLVKMKVKSSLTTLLLGLTISDIFMIGTSFFIFSLSVLLKRAELFPYYSSYIRPHLLPWLLPVALTAQLSSVYFTVIITLERYVAVCHPLKARCICTGSLATRSSLTIVTLSILYNLPRWFEYRAIPKWTCDKFVGYREAETEFRRNEDYILYYINWGYLVVFYLIPFTILGCFNMAIYKVAKEHRSRRNSLSPTTLRNANEDIQLAAMLFGIVCTFIACNFLALVCNIMESFGIGDFGNLIPINNFLIIFSSSSNFIFYFAFGTEFRRQLKEVLGITKADPRKDSNASVYSNISPACIQRQQSCVNNVGHREGKNNEMSRTSSARMNNVGKASQSEECNGSQLTIQTVI